MKFIDGFEVVMDKRCDDGNRLSIFSCGACKKFFHSLCDLINCSCSVPIFSFTSIKMGCFRRRKVGRLKLLTGL